MNELDAAKLLSLTTLMTKIPAWRLRAAVQTCFPARPKLVDKTKQYFISRQVAWFERHPAYMEDFLPFLAEQLTLEREARKTANADRKERTVKEVARAIADGVPLPETPTDIVDETLKAVATLPDWRLYKAMVDGGLIKNFRQTKQGRLRVPFDQMTRFRDYLRDTPSCRHRIGASLIKEWIGYLEWKGKKKRAQELQVAQEVSADLLGETFKGKHVESDIGAPWN